MGNEIIACCSCNKDKTDKKELQTDVGAITNNKY